MMAGEEVTAALMALVKALAGGLWSGMMAGRHSPESRLPAAC